MEWLEIMRELLRTTDLVRLSWCRALLADSHIGTVVLDTHTSVIEGSIGAIPRRLMVSDEDYDEAFRLLGEAGDPGEAGAPESSADRLLEGRVVLRQPKSGYRAAIDPVLLAAAVPATGGTVLDAGCGTGAAALCYAVRVPGARITGLELRPDWAALAAKLAGPIAAGRMWLFTKTASRPYTDASYQRGDVLVFGSETRGLPPELLAQYAEQTLRIPTTTQVRSLNLSVAAAVAMYEAVRQIG